jgi:hypothetical protein
MRILDVSSDNCAGIYPGNLPHDFIIELPQVVNKFGKWEVSLSEIFFGDISIEESAFIYVYCDICQESIVEAHLRPLLRKIHLSEDCNLTCSLKFNNLYSIPLVPNQLRRIRIYIRTEKDEKPSFLNKQVKCTLLIK